MATNIYALLIGIDKYDVQPKGNGLVFRPLKGCVNDTKRMYKYLRTMGAKVKGLKDEKATKAEIITAWQTHLNQATKEDVVLVYFSGHGIREVASEVWGREGGKYLESLVCYNKGDSNCLLSDKELRYLIRQTAGDNQEETPHIVTIFDCCHSGDNTRGHVLPRGVQEVMPMRRWEEFCFAKEIGEEEVAKKSLVEILPQGRHIHLAACGADQVAFEEDGQGRFTTLLLNILEQTHGHISYRDLINQIRPKLQYFPRNNERQIPHVTAMPYLAYEEDLFLPFLSRETEKLKKVAAQLQFINVKTGWRIDKGSIHGLQKGQIVKLEGDGQQWEGEVKRLGLSESSVVFRGDNKPIRDKVYMVELPFDIAHVINVHCKGMEEQEIEELTKENPYIRPLMGQTDEMAIDYWIEKTASYNIYKDVRKKVLAVQPFKKITSLKRSLQQIAEWEFYRQFYNTKDMSRTYAPLEINFYKSDKTTMISPILTDIGVEIPLEYYKAGEHWDGKVYIELVNISTENIYFHSIYLQGNFGYTSMLKELNPSKDFLEPGESIWLNGEEGVPYFLGKDMDYYKDDKYEYLNFVVSNNRFENPRLEKKGLPMPYDKPVQELEVLRSVKSLAKSEWQVHSFVLHYLYPM